MPLLCIIELSPGLNPEDSESLWLRRIKSAVTTPSSLTVKLGWAVKDATIGLGS